LTAGFLPLTVDWLLRRKTCFHLESSVKGSRKEHGAAAMARRPGCTRKSLTRIAPASRRRARRVSVTSRVRGRLAAGLVFSAPATLCTRRTRRLDAETIAARVLASRTASRRRVGSHGGHRGRTTRGPRRSD